MCGLPVRHSEAEARLARGLGTTATRVHAPPAVHREAPCADRAWKRLAHGVLWARNHMDDPRTDRDRRAYRCRRSRLFRRGSRSIAASRGVASASSRRRSNSDCPGPETILRSRSMRWSSAWTRRRTEVGVGKATVRGAGFTSERGRRAIANDTLRLRFDLRDCRAPLTVNLAFAGSHENSALFCGGSRRGSRIAR